MAEMKESDGTVIEEDNPSGEQPDEEVTDNLLPTKVLERVPSSDMIQPPIVSELLGENKTQGLTIEGTQDEDETEIKEQVHEQEGSSTGEEHDGKDESGPKEDIKPVKEESGPNESILKEEKKEEQDYEPPQKTVRKRFSPTAIPVRKVMKVRTPGVMEEELPQTPAPHSSKRRGRQAAKQTEVVVKEPETKRQRKKPNRLKDAAEDEDSEDSQIVPKEDTTDSEGDKVRTPRRKKVLTQQEALQKEEERKKKYQQSKALMKAKKEARVAYFVMKREEKKAKAKEEKRLRAEHEKRMAELKAKYLEETGEGSGGSNSAFFFDESSQTDLKPLKKKWGDVGVLEMSGIHNPLAHVNADTLFEYRWPPEGRNAEHYFLQEQVTEYLQVKSFKRKYPDCPRRNVDVDEKDFLREMKIVNETQADLGLTAIPSSAVLDIMCQDFYDKYEAYMSVLNDRKDRKLRNSNYLSGGGDLKGGEAAKIAAEYNKRLNQERRERRSAYFDMQTFCVHYPKNGKGRMRVLKKPKLGNYPVAMIPGQFVDSYKTYKSSELKYFPLNTVITPPPKSGVTLKDLNLSSDGCNSGSGSSSSGSSDEESSDEERDADQDETESVPKDNPADKDNPSVLSSVAKDNLSAPSSEAKDNLSAPSSVVKDNPSAPSSLAKDNPSVLISVAKDNPSVLNSSAKENPLIPNSNVADEKS